MGEFHGGHETDGSHHVVGTGTPSELLTTPVENGLEVGSLAHEQQSGAFRSTEFVPGERQQVDAEPSHVEITRRKRLDGVGVDEDGTLERSDRRNDLFERLDGTGLVVHGHHRDHDCLRADRVADRVGRGPAVGVDRDDPNL